MDLSLTISETDSDFHRKFFPPCVFCASAQGVLLGIRYKRWESKN